MRRRILMLVSTVGMTFLMFTGCSDDNKVPATNNGETTTSASSTTNNENITDEDVSETEDTEEGTSLETEKRELTYEEKKECAIEIIQAIKECNPEVIKRYEPKYGMEDFIEDMENMKSSEDYAEILEYYKVLASDIIYSESEDKLYIKDRRYIYDKWMEDILTGKEEIPFTDDTKLWYLETVYDIYKESAVYEKYYKDAPYERLEIGLVNKLEFEIDENGNIIAEGLEEIVRDIFDYGVADAWPRFMPTRLVVDMDNLGRMLEDIERGTNIRDKYQPFIDRDFDFMLSVLEEEAKTNGNVQEFLDKEFATEEARNRVKEFMTNTELVEFCHESFYYVENSESGIPVCKWTSVQWSTSDNAYSGYSLYRTFTDLEYKTR